MGWITWTFLGATAFYFALSIWLDARQSRYVAAHRDLVPPDFASRITPEEHHKAADYTLARLRLSTVDLLVSTTLLLFWTLGRGIETLDRLIAPLVLAPILHGTAVIVSVLLSGEILLLPLSIYRTFGIEKHFGFNRTTPAVYVSDRVKGLLVALTLGVPLCLLALWLMEAAGGLWWLWLWIALCVVQLVLMWMVPVLIMPLFNKFTPLADEALRSRIEQLLTRCGFSSRGVFVMDGSKRSTHGNAFFAGFGRSRRVVFFDTLISTLEPEEIEAVLAHELGHFRRGHLFKSLLWRAAVSLALLAALGWLAGVPAFYTQLGVSTPSSHAALLLFAIAAPMFTFLLGPLASLFSRKHEYEADAFAAQQTNGAALARALVKLHRDNANTLTPDPLYSAFYYSHPPAAERIGALEAAGA